MIKILHKTTGKTLLEIDSDTLHGANFQEAILRNPDLRGADFRDTDLRGADFRGVILRNMSFQGADFRGANLQNTNFQEADLYGADFRGANLRGADFRDTCLLGADLRGVILQNTNFHGADFHGADFRDTDLRGADLRGANLYNIVADHILQISGLAYVVTLTPVAVFIGCKQWSLVEFSELNTEQLTTYAKSNNIPPAQVPVVQDLVKAHMYRLNKTRGS